MGKRKGRSVRKNKQLGTAGNEGGDEPEDLARAPHSFVVHRGKTGKFVQELAADFRKVMEPFTASNIKVRPKNVIKDFVHVAGLLKVSHLVMFTKTVMGPYLKIGRFPRGPTLTFRVENYTLGRDVRSSLKRQVTYAKQYDNHALLIMNNFTSGGALEERPMQLMESMFQNMFPAINPTKVAVNSIRRCVLLNYNKETNTIEFRHYTIKVVPVGINRGVRKMVGGSKVPNLGRLGDMAEFMEKGGAGASESEGEEDEASKVTLPQGISSRGSVTGEQSSMRLVELGPRITLSLVKIEEGLLDGEVLHHQFVEKTEEEKKEIKRKREKRKKEKEQRKRDQEKNVKKKEMAKVSNKEKSLEGMKKKEDKEKAWQGEKVKEFEKEQRLMGEVMPSLLGEISAKYVSSDDDEAWFEKEVGAKPDEDDKRGLRKPGEFKSKSKDVPPKQFKGNKFKRSDVKTSAKNVREKTPKNKKKVKVFNSEGVGPNFKKGGNYKGKNPLRGVKRGGKVGKRR